VAGGGFKSGQLLRSSGVGSVEVRSQCLAGGTLSALHFLYIGRALAVEVSDPEVLFGFLGKVSCPDAKPRKPVDSRVAAL
jgi:hypothetical protein